MSKKNLLKRHVRFEIKNDTDNNNNKVTESEEKLLFNILQSYTLNGYDISNIFKLNTPLIDGLQHHPLEIITNILTKEIKSQNDIFMLNIYLSQIDEFKNTFFDGTAIIYPSLEKIEKIILSSENKEVANEVSNADILTRISIHLAYEGFEKNHILMKYGDKGDKFYLVINGDTSILIPIDTYVYISGFNYFKYLIILFIFKERDIFNTVIEKNSKTYSVNIDKVLLLFNLFNTIRLIQDAGDTQKEYIDLLKKSISGNRTIDFFDKNDLIQIMTKYFVGDTLLEILKNEEVYNLFLYFCEKFKELNEKNIPKIVPKKRTLSSSQISRLYNQIEKENFFKPLEIPMKNIYYCSPSNYVIYHTPIANTYEELKENPKLINMNFDKNKVDYIPKILIIQFKVITHLGSGKTIGDVAFHSSMCKRTATVIVDSENCYFGVLTKQIYGMYLKGIKNKLRHQLFSFFTNLQMFYEVDPAYFGVRYFNYFVLHECKRGFKLFSRGEEQSKNYFVKEGEAEITSYINLTELNEIIVSLGGNGFDKKLKEMVDINKNKKYLIKICVLGKNEIIGLTEFINLNQKLFYCTCEVVSNRLKSYRIDKQLFDLILKDRKIKENYIEYFKNKVKMLEKRLSDILNLFIINPHYGGNDFNNNQITLNPIKLYKSLSDANIGNSKSPMSKYENNNYNNYINVSKKVNNNKEKSLSKKKTHKDLNKYRCRNFSNADEYKNFYKNESFGDSINTPNKGSIDFDSKLPINDKLFNLDKNKIERNKLLKKLIDKNNSSSDDNINNNCLNKNIFNIKKIKLSKLKNSYSNNCQSSSNFFNDNLDSASNKDFNRTNSTFLLMNRIISNRSNGFKILNRRKIILPQQYNKLKKNNIFLKKYKEVKISFSTKFLKPSPKNSSFSNYYLQNEYDKEKYEEKFGNLMQKNGSSDNIQKDQQIDLLIYDKFNEKIISPLSSLSQSSNLFSPIDIKKKYATPVATIIKFKIPKI